MPTVEAPIQIVDMDSHYTEPADLWTSRAPAKYREVVPTVKETPEGGQRWYVNGDIEFGNLGYTVVHRDGGKVHGVAGLGRYDEMHLGAYDIGERLRFLDASGIHQQIVFPNVAGFGSNKFMELKDRGLRTACAQIYNDAVAEMQVESGNRLFPQALVPFWDIGDAIAEITRARTKLGLKGIVMCDEPHAFGFPSLDMPEWDPFWSACEDLDLAVNFHIGAGKMKERIPGDEAIRSEWRTMSQGVAIASGTIGSFLNNARVLASLCMGGTLLRHPKLKIVSVESGLAWVLFLLEAMEYQFDEAMSEEERKPFGSQRPTEIFRRNCYVSFWFESYAPRHLVPVIGEENVMYETDFPHPTCLYPGATARVTKTLEGLPYELRKKILHDNAARVYNLPTQA